MMDDWIYGKRRSESGPTKITAGMRQSDSWKLHLLGEELNKLQTHEPITDKAEGFQIAYKDGYDYMLLYDISTGTPITNIGDIKYFSFDSSNTILWTLNIDTNVISAIHVTKELLNPSLAARSALYREAASRIANVPNEEVKTITLSSLLGSICIFSIEFKTVINYPSDNKLLHSLDGKLSITPAQIPTLPNLVWKKDDHGNHILILVVNAQQYDKKWIPKINSLFKSKYKNKFVNTQKLVWDINDLQKWFIAHESENMSTFQKVKNAAPTVLKYGIPLALSPALIGAGMYAYDTIPAVATAVGAIPTFASTIAKGIGKMYGYGVGRLSGSIPNPNQNMEPSKEESQNIELPPKEESQNIESPNIEPQQPMFSEQNDDQPIFDTDGQTSGFYKELSIDELVDLAQMLDNEFDRKGGFVDGLTNIGANIKTLISNIPGALREWFCKETPVDEFYKHRLEPRVITKLDPSQSPAGFKLDEYNRGVVDNWEQFLLVHTPSDPGAWFFNFIGEVQRLIDGKVDLYRCLYNSYTYDQVRKLLDIKWPQFNFTDNFFNEVFCRSIVWCINPDSQSGIFSKTYSNYNLTRWQKNNKAKLWNKNKNLILGLRKKFQNTDKYIKDAENHVSFLKSIADGFQNWYKSKQAHPYFAPLELLLSISPLSQSASRWYMNASKSNYEKNKKLLEENGPPTDDTIDIVDKIILKSRPWHYIRTVIGKYFARYGSALFNLAEETVNEGIDAARNIKNSFFANKNSESYEKMGKAYTKNVTNLIDNADNIWNKAAKSAAVIGASALAGKAIGGALSSLLGSKPETKAEGTQTSSTQSSPPPPPKPTQPPPPRQPPPPPRQPRFEQPRFNQAESDIYPDYVYPSDDSVPYYYQRVYAPRPRKQANVEEVDEPRPRRQANVEEVDEPSDQAANPVQEDNQTANQEEDNQTPNQEQDSQNQDSSMIDQAIANPLYEQNNENNGTSLGNIIDTASNVAGKAMNLASNVSGLVNTVSSVVNTANGFASMLGMT